MTGIERLRELIEEYKPGRYIVVPDVHGSYQDGYVAGVRDICDKLCIIYDQIRGELDNERDRWDRELCEAQMDKTRVMAVYLEMERLLSGQELRGNNSIYRWARELRDALKSDTSDSADAQKPSCANPDGTADVTSEAAKVTRDPAADVSVSAYDLLPQDERDAIAWVREHGGLESVKGRLDWVVGHCSTNQQLDFDFWLSGRVMYALGFDEDMADRDEVERRLLDRLMPEGMEWLLDVWPKWSNGEYCKFGDWWKAEKYGKRKPQQLRRLAFFTPEQLREWGQDEGENFGYEWDFVRPSDTTYRPDKVEPPAPKVLDADGVEIEVDDDLYSVEGMLKFHVSAIDTKNARIATDAMFALDKWADPTMYTHRAPVLAADGRPLREGETVYHVADGRACVVREVREGGAVVEPVDGRPCGRCRADYLTHERPEIDSWERLEEDAAKRTCEYFGYNTFSTSCDGCPQQGTVQKDDCRAARAADIVRRARALAGGA